MVEAYDCGLRLKDLRIKKGLTQAQVGSLIGVTGANIGNYENNIAFPPAEMLKKLAFLYGTTADYLLGIDDRKIIVLDGLTPTQEAAVESVVETIITEFKK